jgi:hypothetical protein
MTIETIVRASGITAGGRIWLQDVTTGMMLFLALMLQSAILSRRGKDNFILMVSKWLNARRIPRQTKI